MHPTQNISFRWNDSNNSDRMTTIKNIIFDFDGTLADTAPLIVKTMHESTRQMGLPERTDEQYRATIGLRLEEIPAALWPKLTDIGPSYAKTYRRIFEELKRPLRVKCFPGVIETLQLLHDNGFGMAIASSRNRKSIEEYIDTFGLEGCFCMLVGGNDVTHGKPAPDPVLSILNAQGWNAAETMTVGDAAVDIQMGKAAGTRTCAVVYGNGTVDALRSSGPDYMSADFHSIFAIAYGVDNDIIQYVENEIIPRYASFDKAHQADHANMVIVQSLKLAAHEPDIDRNMVYVVAAFHDLGLQYGREHHHTDSRKILESDEFLNARFSAEQIRTMGEAVEDHRASKSGMPRSRYGLIVAEADRFIDVDTIIRRTIQFGLKHYPELDKEGHYRRAVEHLIEKYGPNGYLKVWLPYSDNARRLEQLRTVIASPATLRATFDRLFEQEL